LCPVIFLKWCNDVFFRYIGIEICQAVRIVHLVQLLHSRHHIKLQNMLQQNTQTKVNTKLWLCLMNVFLLYSPQRLLMKMIFLYKIISWLYCWVNHFYHFNFTSEREGGTNIQMESEIQGQTNEQTDQIYSQNDKVTHSCQSLKRTQVKIAYE
jgi:hypothetical protein